MKFLLAFGKKDNDLKLWRKALKDNGYSLSDIIAALIKAEINNQSLSLPKIDLSIYDGTCFPNMERIKLTIYDDVAEKALSRIGDYQKAAYIKAIIRRAFSTSSQDKSIKEGLSQITVSNTEKKKQQKKAYNNPVIKQQETKPVEPKIVHTSSVIIDDDDYDYDNAVGDEQAFEPTDSTLDMFAALAGE